LGDLEKREDTFKFGFCPFFKKQYLNISEHNYTSDLYDEIDQYLTKRMDIVNFLKYQDIVDRIRLHLLSNEEYGVLMDFMKIPNLTIKEDLKEFKYFSGNFYEFDKLFRCISNLRPSKRKEFFRFCDAELMNCFYQSPIN
jgi:hypothetical protein